MCNAQNLYWQDNNQDSVYLTNLFCTEQADLVVRIYHFPTKTHGVKRMAIC